MPFSLHLNAKPYRRRTTCWLGHRELPSKGRVPYVRIWVQAALTGWVDGKRDEPNQGTRWRKTCWRRPSARKDERYNRLADYDWVGCGGRCFPHACQAIQWIVSSLRTRLKQLFAGISVEGKSKKAPAKLRAAGRELGVRAWFSG